MHLQELSLKPDSHQVVWVFWVVHGDPGDKGSISGSLSLGSFCVAQAALWRHGANQASCISGHFLSISSPFAIAGPVLMTQLTVLVVSLMLFCNFEFVCLNHSFFYSLCVFNGGCIITDCPLGPARRFLHDDAG